MDDREWLAAVFEEHRSHLRAVAYRLTRHFSPVLVVLRSR